MWYAKMYFSGEKEFFENDAFGMQGLPSKQLELPAWAGGVSGFDPVCKCRICYYGRP